MTERGHYRFTVKESARGHFWVVAEPAGDTIKSLDDCVLGFDLEAGASHGHAVAVAVPRLGSGVGAIRRTSWRAAVGKPSERKKLAEQRTAQVRTVRDAWIVDVAGALALAIRRSSDQPSVPIRSPIIIAPSRGAYGASFDHFAGAGEQQTWPVKASRITPSCR
jgi:hypothetical protein